MQRAAGAAGLDADEAHGVVTERVEDADRVRAATDARHDGVGQPAGALEHLPARLLADHGLQAPHEVRVRVWAGSGADQIVRVLDVRDPVADGVVEGVLEGARAVRDGDHLGAEHLHPHDVGALAAHVLFAHVDDGL